MAQYFTLAIECYREADAVRIGCRLRELVLDIRNHQIMMARVEVFRHGDHWYVFANPQGPGYSEYGYGEGLNDPPTVALITEALYAKTATEQGIRRALCGYEAQDVFDLHGQPELFRFDTPNLVFDRNAVSRQPGAREFGPYYFRN